VKRRYRGENSIMDDLAERFDRSLDTGKRVKIFVDIPQSSSKGKVCKDSQRTGADRSRL
jgi:hypothetical protein